MRHTHEAYPYEIVALCPSGPPQPQVDRRHGNDEILRVLAEERLQSHARYHPGCSAPRSRRG